jgi:peptidoglycan/LPS O-acetylase OafA/YrhL
MTMPILHAQEVLARPAGDSGSGLPRHMQPLDGLRGIAILLVFSLHFFPWRPSPSLAGKVLNGIFGLGWSGVDLFFVLSGFLITGILFETKGEARYFQNFYARRTLRIFPLYYGVLLLFIVVVPLLRLPLNSAPQGSSWWWWVYLSNFRYAFRPNLSSGWLGYFWSLAVEEHFYLVWPAVIYFCSRRGAIAVTIICIILASVSRAFFIHAGNDLAPYVLTPCRMDSLAAGAFVALAARGGGGIRGLGPPAKLIGKVAGALALVVAFWRHSVAWDPVMQMVGFPLITCSYACLIAIAANPPSSSPLRVALEYPLLRSLGKYSYGMYVFHAAVRALFDRIPGFPVRLFPDWIARANDAVNFVVLTFASFAVAYVSWHVYEKHFLRLKRRFDYNRSP